MIIVIGGGITGLAAAYELLRRRLPFVLLEASDRVGGLIATERIGGFTLDAGPDSLLAQKPAAIELCGELGLGPQLMATSPPRTAFVLKRGRLHRLPSPSVLGIPTTSAGAMRYDLLSWRARLRLALEPLVPRADPGDESVASFFRRRFGPDTVDLIAQPLLGGIHAGDIEHLSIASLFPRLVAAERHPRKVMRALRSQPPVGHVRDGLFRALRDGMGALTSAIVTSLPPAAVRLRSAATSLGARDGAWHVGHGGTSVAAGAVILAAPAPTAAALLAPLDPDAARICGGVPYVSTASIALGYRRAQIAHPLRGSGFVVARAHNRLRITACTWVSSKWEARAPRDHALIRAFVGGTHDEDAVDLQDEELIGMAAAELSPVLGISGAPVLARVFRCRNAGAQHTVGHQGRMRELAERLRRHPGLFAVGSGFDSIGIPDCVANGRRAAAEAADYVTMKR